ncbi:MAG: AAA family ATPase [Cetobacterium sp.]|uniref:AAA family ATPase n=1 Tax=Cetobacterium sp. TaxID=2071632 RepID=UPI003F2D0BA4
MLKSFKVKNFKNFKDEIEIDFSNVNLEYNFNENIIKNNIVNKAAIYGKNATGKSNLGLALFDIVKNLTDKEIQTGLYKNYLSAGTSQDYAEFTYIFQIGSSIVEYNYKKSDYNTILDEELKINDRVIIKYDRREKEEPIFNLLEAKNLNKKIGQNKIAVVKYVRNNVLLASNSILSRFFKFVDNMLFFKSVEGNLYLGYTNGIETLDKVLIESNQLESLENFFNEAGIDCKLAVINNGSEKLIAFEFDNDKKIPFKEIASSGTKDLLLLFFWVQRFKELSFVYIDEFDAHYHFELARFVFKKIIEIESVQAIVTTHTTSLINNRILRPDCYFKIENNKIKSLEDWSDRSLQKAHDIEKIYRNGGFDE